MYCYYQYKQYSLCEIITKPKKSNYDKKYDYEKSFKLRMRQ